MENKERDSYMVIPFLFERGDIYAGRVFPFTAFKKTFFFLPDNLLLIDQSKQV